MHGNQKSQLNILVIKMHFQRSIWIIFQTKFWDLEADTFHKEWQTKDASHVIASWEIFISQLQKRNFTLTTKQLSKQKDTRKWKVTADNKLVTSLWG